jgi:arginase family enzyme
LHVDLDGAWSSGELPMPTLDATNWGPQLRFSAPPRLIEQFYSEVNSQLAPFLLFGSGDFHHLSALWARRVPEPVVLVSFDNHPDWDVRPPRWCCGGWVNRALELPRVQQVAVWGCGNFECWWPQQLFGNRRAESAGTLEVHPWADDRPPKDQRRRGAILRDNWRDHFEYFVKEIRAPNVYVTIDLDCLQANESVTNWENGRFSIEDVIWALGRLREEVKIVAGDICGAFSMARYSRWKQRFASETDHPKLTRPDPAAIEKINRTAFDSLWPALTQ